MEDPRKIIWAGATTIIGLLMAGNLFFIIRLVDKVEKTGDTVWQLRQDIVVLNLTVSEFKRVRKGE